MNVQQLSITLEINAEIKELKELGLTQEEIEGYLDMYIDNWLVCDTINSEN